MGTGRKKGDMLPATSLKWTFALLLGPAEEEDIPDVKKHDNTRGLPFKDFVLQTCAKIVKQGLEVKLVAGRREGMICQPCPWGAERGWKR
jgi:hypothetical protein